MKMMQPRIKTAQTSRLKLNTCEVTRTRGSAWMKIREEVMNRDCGICQTCKRNGNVSAATQVDHIIPLHQGGTDAMDNLEAICTNCHSIKTSIEVAALHR
jgi:5-methylcytosine-specific restriction protein A